MNTVKVCFNKYDSGLAVLLYASVPIELYTTRILISDRANTTAQITGSPCKFLSDHSLNFFITLPFYFFNLLFHFYHRFTELVPAIFVVVEQIEACASRRQQYHVALQCKVHRDFHDVFNALRLNDLRNYLPEEFFQL